VQVGGDPSNERYLIARVVADHFLLGVPARAIGVYSAFSELISNLEEQVKTAVICLREHEGIGDAGCVLAYTWGAVTALGKFILKTGLEVAKIVPAAIAKNLLAVFEARSPIDDARALIRGTKDLHIPPTPPARAPTPTPTGAPVPPSLTPTPVLPPHNPTTPQPIDHYDCANDSSDIGHYVPRDRYWQQAFISRGATVSGGWVLLGAHTDGDNHRALVGIYARSGLSSPLATTVVDVTGSDGEHFQFQSPVRVSPGQQLYLAVQGIGDFTAYNSRAGCFISHIVVTR
jgi:hypothetical protein